jgi:hypothetical protein
MFWGGMQSMKETGSYIAKSVNETLETTGAKEKLGQAATMAAPTLLSAKDTVVNTVTPLYERGKENPQIQAAYSTVSGVSTAAFNKADETSGG